VTENVVPAIAMQTALAHLGGKRVAKAIRTIGTSFIINFEPLERVPRRRGRNHWLGGYMRGRTYFLAEGCDWRIERYPRMLSAFSAPASQVAAAFGHLEGQRLTSARLRGRNNSVTLSFSEGNAIVVLPGNDGSWWIGSRTGTISVYE